MKITNTAPDGTVTVEMSDDEAAAIRDNLGTLRVSEISQTGGELHSILKRFTQCAIGLTLAVEMTAEEAAAVRADLGAIEVGKVSGAGDLLRSLLEPPPLAGSAASSRNEGVR